MFWSLAQPLGNDRDRHAIAQQAAGVRVPQRMQAGAFEADIPHQFHHAGAQTVG